VNDYRFRLVRDDGPPLEGKRFLRERPFTAFSGSFAADARRFVSGEALEIAINTAIAVGEPLLITGEPGTGKTQAAYYAAYRLGLSSIFR
jgi:MoxR-like ATPase